MKRCGFDLWVRKSPWRRAWQPAPIFLPGESPWTEEPSGYIPCLKSVTKRWTWLSIRIVDLQCCVSFRCTAVTQLSIHIYPLLFRFCSHTGHYRVLNGVLCAAAAAAKSLQSCSTLYDRIGSSPPGSAVPGIVQARALEWVAIAFSAVLYSRSLLVHLFSV